MAGKLDALLNELRGAERAHVIDLPSLPRRVDLN